MMNDPITISQADEHDLEALTELFDQYRIFYGQASNKPACNHFLFERIINHESVIYLARMNSKAVGFTQLYPSFSSVSLQPLWILNDLYVAPEARKQGVARALIQQTQNLVLERKDKGLSLSTAVENKMAQRVYDETGFVRDTAFYHYDWLAPQPVLAL